MNTAYHILTLTDLIHNFSGHPIVRAAVRAVGAFDEYRFGVGATVDQNGICFPDIAEPARTDRHLNSFYREAMIKNRGIRELCFDYDQITKVVEAIERCRLNPEVHIVEEVGLLLFAGDQEVQREFNFNAPSDSDWREGSLYLLDLMSPAGASKRILYDTRLPGALEDAAIRGAILLGLVKPTSVGAPHKCVREGHPSYCQILRQSDGGDVLVGAVIIVGNARAEG